MQKGWLANGIYTIVLSFSSGGKSVVEKSR